MSRLKTAVAVTLALAAGQASAHAPSKSLGNFFSGFIHSLMEPAQLVALIALSLYLGQRTVERNSTTALCFAGAIGVGLVACAWGFRPDTEAMLLVIAALTGLAVAAAMPVPDSVARGAFLAAGLAIGLASRPDGPLTTGALAAALIGAGLGAIVWLINGAVLVEQVRQKYWSVLVRVVGSWTAAASVLVLALLLSGKHVYQP